MNLNTSAKRILAFGDSNTWGCIPSQHSERFSLQQRWPALLQNLLGQDYEVIEEGLKGRTTVLDDILPGREGRNGLIYLIPCLITHSPLDLVIIMLGTNDLKERFNQQPADVVKNMARLLDAVLDINSYATGSLPKILLISPPIVEESNPLAQEKYRGAREKSLQLAAGLRKLAQKYHCGFWDAASLVMPSTADGLHLDADSHKAVATELCKQIPKII